MNRNVWKLLRYQARLTGEEAAYWFDTPLSYSDPLPRSRNDRLWKRKNVWMPLRRTVLGEKSKGFHSITKDGAWIRGTKDGAWIRTEDYWVKVR